VARVTGPANPFDGCVYVVLKGEKDEWGVPVGVTKHFGMALSVAGEFGAAGIERVSEGMWEGALDGCDRIYIYRMGLRGS
jgi:hypothetical protein